MTNAHTTCIFNMRTNINTNTKCNKMSIIYFRRTTAMNWWPVWSATVKLSNKYSLLKLTCITYELWAKLSCKVFTFACTFTLSYVQPKQTYSNQAKSIHKPSAQMGSDFFLKALWLLVICYDGCALVWNMTIILLRFFRLTSHLPTLEYVGHLCSRTILK